jgi:hypothetical protein
MIPIQQITVVIATSVSPSANVVVVRTTAFVLSCAIAHAPTVIKKSLMMMKSQHQFIDSVQSMAGVQRGMIYHGIRNVDLADMPKIRRLVRKSVTPVTRTKLLLASTTALHAGRKW